MGCGGPEGTHSTAPASPASLKSKPSGLTAAPPVPHTCLSAFKQQLTACLWDRTLPGLQDKPTKYGPFFQGITRRNLEISIVSLPEETVGSEAWPGHRSRAPSRLLHCKSVSVGQQRDLVTSPTSAPAVPKSYFRREKESCLWKVMRPACGSLPGGTGSNVFQESRY